MNIREENLFDFLEFSKRLLEKTPGKTISQLAEELEISKKYAAKLRNAEHVGGPIRLKVRNRYGVSLDECSKSTS